MEWPGHSSVELHSISMSSLLMHLSLKGVVHDGVADELRSG